MAVFKKGSLAAVGIGSSVAVHPGNWLVYSLEVAVAEAFDGAVHIDKSEDGGATWTPIANYNFVHGSEGALGIAEVNRVVPKVLTHYRARCSRYEDDSNAVAYRLSEHSHERIVTDPLELIDITLEAPTTKVTTSGSEGSEQVSIGVPPATLLIGTRKVIMLEKLTHASDVLELDEGDIVGTTGQALAAVTLDGAGAFVLLENNGNGAWQVIYSHDATLTDAE